MIKFNLKQWNLGKQKTPFRELIEQDSSITDVLSSEELDDCFDPKHHLNQVDTIFARAGLS